MGTLTYADTVIGFDDRVLTHLQIVVIQKLRRGESFTLSWLNGPSAGSGRGAIWLSPYQPLHFQFDERRLPEIDGTWLARLTESADGPRGLLVLDVQGHPIAARSVSHRHVDAGNGRRR
jgi:hypothetical protein